MVEFNNPRGFYSEQQAKHSLSKEPSEYSALRAWLIVRSIAYSQLAIETTCPAMLSTTQTLFIATLISG